MTTQWLAAIGVAAAIGFTASFHFLTLQRRRDDTAAGIVALSATSWRGFIGMVLKSLTKRGYVQVVDPDEASGDRDFILEREGTRWLLSCKHGASYVLGRNAVQALSSEMLLHSAARGLLVTQGRIDAEAHRLAAQQRIELLDGAALWPEVRDFMPAEELDAIRAKTGALARRRVLMSWLFALLAGVAAFIALAEHAPPASPRPATATTPATAPPPPAPHKPSPPEPAPTAAPAPVTAPEAPPAEAAVATDVPDSDSTPVDATPQAEAPSQVTPAETAQTAPAPAITELPPPQPGSPDERRRQLAREVNALPDVQRAVWVTSSTLQIFLPEVNDQNVLDAICARVLRYDGLTSSRLQLSPPPDSGQMTRFLQCRSY